MAFASRLRSWLAPPQRSPRLLIAGGAVLFVLFAGATVLAMRAENARREQAERAQAARVQQETRRQLALLQRREAQLQAEERSKQQLAARDTMAFQRAALEADLASQQRDLQVQRRTAFERQAAQLKKEQERQRQAVQALLKENVRGKLDQEGSEACLLAYSRYEAAKRDAATAPEKLASDLAAVRQLCNS
jgi:flagellar biosynthesis GTPase FlhF